MDVKTAVMDSNVQRRSTGRRRRVERESTSVATTDGVGWTKVWEEGVEGRVDDDVEEEKEDEKQCKKNSRQGGRVNKKVEKD